MPGFVHDQSHVALRKLASNENPFGPSPKVQQAVIRAAGEVHRYPDNQVRELRARVAHHHAVRPEEIAFGHGSSPLIDLIIRTFATPAEHAVIGAPSFPAYAIALAAANIETSAVALREGMFWDLAHVQAAVRPETKLVFLDNPGNPTSTHIPEGELRRFLRDLPEEVVVVIDEAYAEFSDAPDYSSALSMRDLRARWLVLRTFSKAYALAGLRVGYALGPRELTAPMEMLRDPFSINGLAQVAALAALDDPGHVERTVASNARERARLSTALEGLGLSVAPSQTNFLFVRFPGAASEIQRRLMEQGLVVRPLGGPGLDKHLRISIGLPEENDLLLLALAEQAWRW
jgi:histidinol-phosphate aminotransferase